MSVQELDEGGSEIRGKSARYLRESMDHAHKENTSSAKRRDSQRKNLFSTHFNRPTLAITRTEFTFRRSHRWFSSERVSLFVAQHLLIPFCLLQDAIIEIL